MVRLVNRWLHALQRWTWVDEPPFNFLVPALTTFFGDEHWGHLGGLVCSKSEKSVSSVLVFDFNDLLGIFWMMMNGL